MSFFFDVWTNSGFVLASDVRLLENGEQKLMHKIVTSGPSSKIKCAIAVCGDYPRTCANFFRHAWMVKDSLHDIAQDFASQWTERYAGTQDYSAVHLVGFEKIGTSNTQIPQVWFWCNWGLNGYLTKAQLAQQLADFSRPVPFNDHIPQKIVELGGQFPHSLEEEHKYVTRFLSQRQPYFSWNGDTDYWRGAMVSVAKALKQMPINRSSHLLDQACDMVRRCIGHVIGLGYLLPNSTVGFSNEGEFDMVKVTPDQNTWVHHAKI